MPLEKRNGGSVWVAGSYDPASNLVYFGVAPTYDTGPYRDDPQGGVTNDLLYTESTVAINADTGKLVWHFQHQPNDQWDFDWAFGRVLFKMPIGGTVKTVVATSGKQAIYDVVEAETGKYVVSMDLGLQNVVTNVDPRTGSQNDQPQADSRRQGRYHVCPHAGGAKSWLPESYNPDTNAMLSARGILHGSTPVVAGGRGSLSTGVRWTLRPRADSDGSTDASKRSTWRPRRSCGPIVSVRRFLRACLRRLEAWCLAAPSIACLRPRRRNGKNGGGFA